MESPHRSLAWLLHGDRYDEVAAKSEPNFSGVFCRKWVLVLTIALLSVIESATAATQGDTSNASQSSARDLGWPREVTRNGVRLVYYQPQVDECNDFRKLKASLAIVLTPKNGKPAVGVEEVETNTDANLQQRTVLIDNIKITSVRFPSLSGAEEAEMQDLLRTTFPGRPLFAGNPVYKKIDDTQLSYATNTDS
jgi:hypothetical protein